MEDNQLTSEQLEKLSWINKETLEEIIKNEEKLDKIIVQHYKKEPLVANGENYGSNICRVCVTYQDSTNEKKELGLVVKSGIEEVEDGIFNREREFYKTAKPKLEKIFTNLTGINDPHLFAPRYFHSDKPCAFILEEMRGYKMGNRREGYSLSQIQHVVKYLARFHATSLAWYEEDPTLSEKFSPKILYTEEKYSLLDTYFVKGISALAEEVDSWPGYQHYKEKLIRYRQKATTLIINSRKPNAAKHFACIHGDCWINNILMNEEKVVMVDYQVYHWAPIAIDITQLFYTSFRSKERQKYFDSLIQLYIDEIQKNLQLLHLDPNQISFESIRNDCLAMLPVSITVPLCYHQLTVLPQESEKVNISCLFTDEFLDPGSPWRKAYRNENYIKEMKQLLDEAESMGIFN